MKDRVFADLVVENGNIWTMDEQNPRANALAVFLDRIVKVGTMEEISELIGPKTKIIDGQGNTVLPGFIDAHTHLASVGLNSIQIDLGGKKSINEVLGTLEKEIHKTTEGEWIIGRNWDQSEWKEERYITASDLDTLGGRNPILLRHVSGHLSTVNTVGFNRLELSKDIDGVDLDDDGEIIGTLRDVELDDHPEIKPSLDEYVDALKLGMEKAIKVGITSIHDNLTFDSLKAYRKILEDQCMQIRVYGIVYQDLFTEIKKVGIKKGLGDKWFKIGAVKLMTDGAISSRTAYLFEDYSDMKGEKGFALYDSEMLEKKVEEVHKAGLQLAVHTIGDKAVTKLLDAIEKTIPADECKNARHRIEHAELVLEQDIERSRIYGIVYSMQPNFVWRWGRIGVNGMYEQRLGKERTLRNNPSQWVLNNGLILAFGSDCMPMDPLFGIKGALFHPNEELRLDLEQAIRCYTLEPAKVSGEITEKGSLSYGKLADLIVLNKNIENIGLEEFDSIEVDCTIVGGKIVYKKDNITQNKKQ